LKITIPSRLRGETEGKKTIGRKLESINLSWGGGKFTNYYAELQEGNETYLAGK